MKKFLISQQDLPENSTVNTPKRRRDLNSPEEVKQHFKRQQTDINMDLSASALKSIAQLLDRKLEEKLEFMATKEDVSSLREEIRNLKAENDSLKTEVKLLHENEVSLRRQMQFWDNKLREKNVIIHGLQAGNKNDEDLKNSVNRLCVDVLKTSVKIVDAHFLGNENNVQKPPILITLSSAADVKIMLRNSKLLKGTSIFLQKDMSKKVREQLGTLHALKKEVLKINRAIDVKVQSGRAIVLNGMKFWLSENDDLQTNERENFQKLAQLINNKNIDDVVRLAKQRKSYEPRSSIGIPSCNSN